MNSSDLLKLRTGGKNSKDTCSTKSCSTQQCPTQPCPTQPCPTQPCQEKCPPQCDSNCNPNPGCLIKDCTGPQGPIGPQGPAGTNSNNNIGRAYQGGYIAAEWVEGPSLTKKVLIVSNPQNAVFRKWTVQTQINNTVPAPGATNRYDGAPNTTAIVAQAVGCIGCDPFAAQYANNLTTGGYTDWYLPSIEELNMVYNAAVPITRSLAASGLPPPYFNFASGYWSSTENDPGSAFYYNFIIGDINTLVKSLAALTLSVRIANI